TIPPRQVSFSRLSASIPPVTSLRLGSIREVPARTSTGPYSTWSPPSQARAQDWQETRAPRSPSTQAPPRTTSESRATLGPLGTVQEPPDRPGATPTQVRGHTPRP